MNITFSATVLALVLAFLPGAMALSEAAAAETMEQQLQTLLAQKSAHAADPAFLLRLADLYLDVGDNGAQESAARQAAYEAGAGIAKQAMELHDSNAHAHYLYAANLGSAAQIKGLMASALTVKDIQRHVSGRWN